MIKRNVYCEYDFWKQLNNLLPKSVAPNPDIIKRTQNWLNLYAFLCKSNIKFDFTLEDMQTYINKGKDTYLLYLWKRSTNGECKLTCEGSDFPNLEKNGISKNNSKKLSSIYLSTNEKIKESSKKYGVLAITPNTIASSEHLYKDNGFLLRKKSNSNSWQCLQKHNNACNALVIIDNYLFLNKDSYDKNLLSLLDALLPQSLEIPFDISLFCDDKETKTTGGEPYVFPRDIWRERYETIKCKVQDLRPDMQFHISLYVSRNKFHDRVVLSNNIWIESGAGFNLFVEDRNNPSKIIAINNSNVSIITPFLQTCIPRVDNAYESYLDLTRKIISYTSENTPETTFFGGMNRIYDILPKPKVHEHTQTQLSCPPIKMQ